jgi:hypothetical protein
MMQEPGARDCAWAGDPARYADLRNPLSRENTQ